MLIGHLFVEHRDLSHHGWSRHDDYFPNFARAGRLQAAAAAKAVDRVGGDDRTRESESVECPEGSRTLQDCAALRVLETVPGDRNDLHSTLAEPVHENQKQSKRREHRTCASRFLRRFVDRRFSSQVHQSLSFA